MNEENKKEFIDYNKSEKETFENLDKNKHYEKMLICDIN